MTLLRHPASSRFLSSFLLLCAPLLPGCDQGSTPIGGFDDAGCTEPTADSGPGESLPIAVDCSFSFGGVSQTVRYEAVEPTGELEPIAVGGDLLVSASVSDDEFEGRSFQITVYTEAGTVSATAIYQMAPGTRPVNEFWGDHGFTGLNWVGDPATGETLQYACFASDPADPIHAWED